MGEQTLAESAIGWVDREWIVRACSSGSAGLGDESKLGSAMLARSVVGGGCTMQGMSMVAEATVGKSGAGSIVGLMAVATAEGWLDGGGGGGVDGGGGGEVVAITKVGRLVSAGVGGGMGVGTVRRDG